MSPPPKSSRRYRSKLYCKWGQLLCFEKNLWKFKQLFKILFKNLKVLKMFLKVLKKLFIIILKILWKLQFYTTIYSYCWLRPGLFPIFCNCSGVSGRKSFSSPRLRHVYTVQCTVCNETSKFSQFQIQCK